MKAFNLICRKKEVECAENDVFSYRRVVEATSLARWFIQICWNWPQKVEMVLLKWIISKVSFIHIEMPQ